MSVRETPCECPFCASKAPHLCARKADDSIAATMVAVAAFAALAYPRVLAVLTTFALTAIIAYALLWLFDVPPTPDP